MANWRTNQLTRRRHPGPAPSRSGCEARAQGDCEPFGTSRARRQPAASGPLLRRSPDRRADGHGHATPSARTRSSPSRASSIRSRSISTRRRPRRRCSARCARRAGTRRSTAIRGNILIAPEGQRAGSRARESASRPMGPRRASAISAGPSPPTSATRWSTAAGWRRRSTSSRAPTAASSPPTSRPATRRARSSSWSPRRSWRSAASRIGLRDPGEVGGSASMRRCSGRS